MISQNPIEITIPSDTRPSPPDSKAHHPKKGSKKFRNPWPSFTPLMTLSSALGAIFRGDLSRPKIPKDVKMQVGFEAPSFETGDKSKIKATWFGHACFYIELPCNENQERGLRILFDPVLSQRCSPVSFAGPKRYTDPAASVDQLPEIDLVCISHNHYDHMDKKVMIALHKRFGNSIHFFIPLGVAKFFKGLKINNVTELDWWEERIYRKNGLEARIGYLPAQHFTGRGLLDQAKSLWGSYSVESTSHPDKKIWFAGDTGRRSVTRKIYKNLPQTQAEYDNLPVCPAHKQIGDLRGPFAFAMIPIGAYQPRYLMSPIHINPEEAVAIFKEIRAEKAAAMHWGTFVLTMENVLEPREKLGMLCIEQGIEGFEAWKIGERREI